MRPRLLVAGALGLLICGIASAESRLGRHVLKLADETGIVYVKRTLFPVSSTGLPLRAARLYRAPSRPLPLQNGPDALVAREVGFRGDEALLATIEKARFPAPPDSQ